MSDNVFYVNFGFNVNMVRKSNHSLKFSIPALHEGGIVLLGMLHHETSHFLPDNMSLLGIAEDDIVDVLDLDDDYPPEGI